MPLTPKYAQETKVELSKVLDRDGLIQLTDDLYVIVFLNGNLRIYEDGENGIYVPRDAIPRLLGLLLMKLPH